MPKQLKAGDRVAWQSSGGGSLGRVERKLTSPAKIKGHVVGASEDNAGGTGPPQRHRQDVSLVTSANSEMSESQRLRAASNLLRSASMNQTGPRESVLQEASECRVDTVIA
jgi:hypothetical protein